MMMKTMKKHQQFLNLVIRVELHQKIDQDHEGLNLPQRVEIHRSRSP